jgi:NADPH:quinone reductase-like Zn-dependent oxidoreductase
MKAMVYRKYGNPEVLGYEECDKPVPKSNEVLVKVVATAINPMDWYFLTGKPYLVRLMGSGLFHPKKKILGVDIAGIIEAVGNEVNRFKVGDAVFGACKFGGLAEFVCATESGLELKPSNVSFHKAAAIPVAAITAYQALKHKVDVVPGNSVLINGASGGVGTFAVQIAKFFGARVTGICSTANLEMVRSLGADHVIDYTREDFRQYDEQYDVILDAAAYRSVSDYRNALKPRGKYIMIGGESYQMIKLIFLGIWVALTSPKRMEFMMAKIKSKDLAKLRELMEYGAIDAKIDRIYPLERTAAAFEYLGKKHAKGKVIIEVQNTLL